MWTIRQHAKGLSFWRYLAVSKEIQTNKDVKKWYKPIVVLNMPKNMYKLFISKHQVPQIYNYEKTIFVVIAIFGLDDHCYIHTRFVCYSFIFRRHLWIPYINYKTMLPYSWRGTQTVYVLIKGLFDTWLSTHLKSWKLHTKDKYYSCER